MIAKFYFSETATESDIVRASFSITYCYYNELSPADNSMRFMIPYNVTIANLLKQSINKKVRVVVEDDDGNPVFTGYIRQRLGFSKIIRNASIQVEVVSPSFMLNKKSSAPIILTGQTVNTCWRAVLTAAGWTDIATGVPTISDTIPIFFLNAGENYKEVLTELLFEYGYTFDFDANGDFVLYSLFNAPSSPVTLEDGDGGHVFGQCVFNANERRYDGMSAKWTDCVSGSELVFQDLSEHVTGDSIFDGAWYADYEASKKIIYISSIQSDIESGGQQVTVDNEGDRAKITFASVSNPRVTKIAITGTGYFSTVENTTKVSDGDNPKEHTIRYCFSKTKIESLCGKVRDYYKYSGLTATFLSDIDMAPGSFATLTVEGQGTLTGRIVRKLVTIDNYPQYELESVTAYTPAIAATTRRDTRYASAIASTIIQQAQTLIHGIRTIASLDEEGAYTNEIANYKGTLYEWDETAWSKVNTSGYLGAFSAGEPLAREGNFFLATDDFINPVLYAVEAGANYVLGIGDYVLGVNGTFNRGSIYDFNGSMWVEITDPNDYRYIIALADMHAAGFEPPPAIKDMVQQQVVQNTPSYLGVYDALPSSANVGDWVVYAGTAEGLVKGDVYKFTGLVWEHILPTANDGSRYYMQALSDVISTVPNVTGRYSTIFAELFMAMRLVVGHAIQSNNFNGSYDDEGNIIDTGTTGYALTKAGKQVLNDVFVRGTINVSELKISGFTPGDKLALSVKGDKESGVGYIVTEDVICSFTGSFNVRFLSSITPSGQYPGGSIRIGNTTLNFSGTVIDTYWADTHESTYVPRVVQVNDGDRIELRVLSPSQQYEYHGRAEFLTAQDLRVLDGMAYKERIIY